MKRHLCQLIVLLCLSLMVASCQKAPFVTLNTPRSFTFSRDGGTHNITFTCYAQRSGTFSRFYDVFCSRPHFPIRGLPRFSTQEAVFAPDRFRDRSNHRRVFFGGLGPTYPPSRGTKGGVAPGGSAKRGGLAQESARKKVTDASR